MARVRSGDDEAFGWIYDRYAGSLLAYCRHTLGTREEAEDALQHVFVAAHKQMRLQSPPQQLKPWLYAVARNRCLSVLRARRETVALDDVVEPPGGADVCGEAERREDIREVLADVAALPHEQREALILAEVGALSHEEIAVALDVRKEKVKALVFQARQSLMVSREARETTCRDIQEQLSVLRGGALRRSAIRRHVDRCPACAAFKGEVQRQRSLLAAALPVLPAAALKPTILSAAHAGATGGGVAAAGGISAAAAASGSSTAVGGGLTGLGSSALVTKVLAVGAVASIAVGGGTAVVRSTGTGDGAAATPRAARAAPATAATKPAASTSPISLTSAPSGPPAAANGAADPKANGRPQSDRATGQRSAGPANGPAAAGPDATPEATGIDGPKVPEHDLSPRASTTPESAGPGPSAGQAHSPGRPSGVTSAPLSGVSDSATPGASARPSDSAKSGSSTGESDMAKPASPPGQAHSAKPASPPGQAKDAKPESPAAEPDNAKPASPPGQANSAKPESSGGESNDAKPASPPGQANSAKPVSAPGQSDTAKPEPPAAEPDDAKPASPPGQSKDPKTAS